MSGNQPISDLPLESDPQGTDYLVGDFGNPAVTKRVRISDLPDGGAGSDTATTSQIIPALSLTYIKADGTLDLADASSEGKEAISFVAEGYGAGVAAVHYLSGNVIEGLVGLTPGVDYYMSETAGAITATPPSTLGNVVLKIGTAISATKIAFNPSIPVTL